MLTVREPRRVTEDIHDRPWVGLVYLLFVFIPLFFWQNRPMSAVWASVATVLVFLPLHFRFYQADLREARWLVLPVAAIGYALIPFNSGGNTFIIYAFAMSATVFAPRTAILACVGFLALMGVEFYFLPTPWRVFAYGTVAVTALIGAVVVAGILYARIRNRRNAELRLTQDEVGRLAAMAERERIGRDLHDLLGHTLSLVAIKSELAGRLIDRDPTAARIQIGEVETVARQALAQVREAVVGIRAAGLQAELAAARLALLSAEVHLDQRLAPVALPAAVESVLALALREAVTNVLRHAAATRVEVELSQEPTELRLTISDDGRGGAGTPGHGLSGMRERLAAIGGRLDLDSPAGAGTRLTIALPLAALEGPA